MDPKYGTKTSLGEIFDPGKLITFGFLEGNMTICLSLLCEVTQVNYGC